MDMQKDSENKNLPKTDITAIPEQPQDAKADPENKDESDLQISSKQQKTDPDSDGTAASTKETSPQTDPAMKQFNEEDASFSTDRYTLVKPVINAPTADFKKVWNLVKLWKGNKQYYVFIMVKTGISEEMVRALVMKVLDKKSTKSDSDLSFIAALSVLTGNDFLHKVYPTFEECYTAQALREMVRDYYNGPTREDRDRYEKALARAEVSQRTVDELRKQLEKYQEVFISHNDTSIKREELIRADYRAMMEKDRASFEKEMTIVLDQKDEKIKELEKENEELKHSAEESKENQADPASMVAILKERDDCANEVQRLKKNISEKDGRIEELENKLKEYQEAEKEKEIRSRIKEELRQEYEAESTRFAEEKEKEIERKEEELKRARQEISQLREEAESAKGKDTSEGSASAPLTDSQLHKIAEYVSEQMYERKAAEEDMPVEIEEDIEDEILREVEEAQKIYDALPPDAEEDLPEAEEEESTKTSEDQDMEDILPRHVPSPRKRPYFEEGRKREKPPLFFRRHWEERREMEEIEELGFQVIASEEYSEVQKNLIQEAIDNNLSLKNLRRLADPSIPEKNMSQALHYFLRIEKKAS